MEKRNREPIAGLRRGNPGHRSGPLRLVRGALTFGLGVISAAFLLAAEGHAAPPENGNEPAVGHPITASRESSARLLLADRMETRDQIIYRTDSGGMKTHRELEREEKEKEDRSWRMLDQLEIFPSRPRHRGDPTYERRE